LCHTLFGEEEIGYLKDTKDILERKLQEIKERIKKIEKKE